MEEEKTKKLVTVYDADFIPYYVCHNKKDSEEIKTLEDCLSLTDDFINNINLATKADIFVGFLTVGKCFRYRINPSYKSNRKYTDQPLYLKEVKQYLIDKYEFTYDEEYEADDLVISYKKQHPEYKCVIVSPDKDILNLKGTNFNPRKMEYVITSEEEEIEYFWKSMIIGDGIDGVKGIPKCGVKAAEMMSIEVRINRNEYYEEVLKMYIYHFGEHEGVKEFYKNYMSLKIVNNVIINNVKLHEISEQETRT